MRISMLPSLLLIVSSSLLAQSTPTPQPPATPGSGAQPRGADLTLRAQAKLVVVDVVVTDRNGAAVQNLKQPDFTVTEEKQPQSINSFEEHKGVTAAELAKLSPAPKLPPGVFTNFVPTPVNQAVNIILLDALNTPMQDQMYVRQQLLNYLKTAPPGRNTAIFGLSTKLVMLQGFTSDPEVLKTVVTKSLSKASVLLDDAVGGGGMPDNADDVNQDMGGLMSSDVVANMQTFMDITQSFQLMLRARYTLDGMNILARYLASIPGRKNLIWFSGSFPLDILPDVTDNASDPFAAMADAEEEYRETTNLLARAQVAVYPIDGRGLQTSPTMSAATSGAKYARNPSAMGRDETKFFNSNTAEHSTMDRMAEDTGGHAYYNTNGLTAAVEKAISNGANYYTLTYTPTDTKYNGNFRKIQVKLAQQGYQLEYRHGYYADDPSKADSVLTSKAPGAGVDASGVSQDPQQIVRAMVHGVPGSTQILFKIRAIPTSTAAEDTVAPENILGPPKDTGAKPPYRRYTIDYAVAPKDISYRVTADGNRHAMIEFVAVVYKPDGTIVNHTSKEIGAAITPEQYKRLQQVGIQFRQEISVPEKGEYSLRIAIHDLADNRIGTTEINIAAIKNLPPLATLQPPAQQPAKAPTPTAPPPPAIATPPPR